MIDDERVFPKKVTKNGSKEFSHELVFHSKCPKKWEFWELSGLLGFLGISRDSINGSDMPSALGLVLLEPAFLTLTLITLAIVEKKKQKISLKDALISEGCNMLYNRTWVGLRFRVYGCMTSLSPWGSRNRVCGLCVLESGLFLIIYFTFWWVLQSG